MKGELVNRQGLSVSGALLLALDQVCMDSDYIYLCKILAQNVKFESSDHRIFKYSNKKY